MVYNGFPATYQPMFNQQQMPMQQMPIMQPVMQQSQPQQQQQQGSGVMCVWVQGESGAKGYPVAAGTEAERDAIRQALRKLENM